MDRHRRISRKGKWHESPCVLVSCSYEGKRKFASINSRNKKEKSLLPIIMHKTF